MLTGPRTLRASVVHSQFDVHERYGGVVPELASRAHILAIDSVAEAALAEAGMGWGDVDAVAVTQGPGLKGSLLVGIEYAKGVAAALDVPLVPAHHLAGHLRAPWLETSAGFAEPRYPFVGLVVSGGHTSLYRCDGPDNVSELGRTLDDAAGEAFDKVAKVLGLGYPGGPRVDQLAREGDASAFWVPRPMINKGGFHFSFSGVKTFIAQHVEREGVPSGSALRDVCAGFQEAVAEVLAVKAVRAARRGGLETVVVTGGVACNSRVRSRMQEEAGRYGIEVVVPPPALCTDNAAMIGAAAYAAAARAVEAGARFDGASLDARATWPLAPPAPVAGA